MRGVKLLGQSSEMFQRGLLTYVTGRNLKNYYPINSRFRAYYLIHKLFKETILFFILFLLCSTLQCEITRVINRTSGRLAKRKIESVWGQKCTKVLIRFFIMKSSVFSRGTLSAFSFIFPSIA